MPLAVEKVTQKPKWEIRADCRWAQRSHASDAAKNVIMLTIDLPNVTGASSLDLQPTYLLFNAQTGRIGVNGVPEDEYIVDIKFHRLISPQDTKIFFTPTSLLLLLRKADLDGNYWPRLREATNDWVGQNMQDGNPLDESSFVSVQTPGLGRRPPMCGMPPGKRKAKRKTIK